MNIYMPYPDLNKSAETLDDKRLQKVRSDIITVLRACTEPAPLDGKEHSAIKMWRGNELFLANYGMAICAEWMSRGNNDNTLAKIMEARKDFDGAANPPEWLGDKEYHESIQSQLVRLQPSHYKPIFPDVADDLALVWPRTPPKVAVSPEVKEQEKKVKRAFRLKERANNAYEDFLEAAKEANLNPQTMKELVDETDKDQLTMEGLEEEPDA